MRTARAVAALTVWIVFGSVAFRCLAEGAIGLGIAAFLVVLAHAVVELALRERADRRARMRYLAAQRAAADPVLGSYTPDQDRFYAEMERWAG